MGKVFESLGALSAAVETTYGTDPTPTLGLLLIGQPDLNHDDSFPEEEYLSLSSVADVPARQHNKLDLSFKVALGPMKDVDSGQPSVHPVLLACGMEIKDEAGAGGAGSGNYIEYGPSSTYKSATLYYYLKEDGASHLGVQQLLGYRGTFTLNITPGEAVNLDVEGQSKHKLRDAFSAGTAPASVGGGLGSYSAKCFAATLDGEDLEVLSMTLARGLEVGADTDAITNCADGVEEVTLTPGAITGTLVVPMTSELFAASGNNFVRASHDAEVDHVFILTRDDGVTTWTLTIPVMRWRDMQETGGEDRKQMTIEFIALPTSGDDEFTMKWEVQ